MIPKHIENDLIKTIKKVFVHSLDSKKNRLVNFSKEEKMIYVFCC